MLPQILADWRLDQCIFIWHSHKKCVLSFDIPTGNVVYLTQTPLIKNPFNIISVVYNNFIYISCNSLLDQLLYVYKFDPLINTIVLENSVFFPLLYIQIPGFNNQSYISKSNLINDNLFLYNISNLYVSIIVYNITTNIS